MGSVCHLWWTGECLGVSSEAFTASFQSATLVWLARCGGTGRLASGTAHSDGDGGRYCEWDIIIYSFQNHGHSAVIVLSKCVPFCSVRGSTGSPAPDTAACGGVAGLRCGKQGTGVGGHVQREQSAQCDPVEASWQVKASGPARHGKRHRTVNGITHSRDWERKKGSEKDDQSG